MSQFQPPPVQPYWTPQQYQYGSGQMTPRTSGLAIASLICGIAGLVVCGLVGIAGLILGIASLRSISASEGTRTGKGLAIAGIITSAISILLTLLLVALLIPALGKARETAAAVRQSAQGQALASIVYEYDYDNDVLPSPDDWVSELRAYTGSARRIDDLIGSEAYPFDGRIIAMNAQLADTSLAEIEDPGSTVLFFECEPGGPASGGAELLASEPRNWLGHFIIFADGMADFVSEDELHSLRWSP